MRWSRSWLLLSVLALAGACANYRPLQVRAGMTESEATALIGKPTNRYPGPDGQTRVEFAFGPWGRVTWMVDLDAAGKVIDAKQVLTEANLNWFQRNAGGHDAAWVRYQLGRPAEVLQLGWIGGQVWSWRYPTYECLWFQVTINEDRTLRDTGGWGIDPSCDIRLGVGR